MSHKELESKSKNREYLSFKFKPDSIIRIKSIKLSYLGLDRKETSINNNVLKYCISNNNLDIDAIFNKKGKYKINYRI
jgi:hypothetical protein